MKLRAFFFVLCIFVLAGAANAKTVIKLWDKNLTPPSEALLKLLLDSTVTEFEDYQLQIVPGLEQARAQKELAQGRTISLLIFATNAEREQQLLPIRIPLTKGFSGYRVCIINKTKQGLFSPIKTLDDWQQSGLLIGQGTLWPDVQILRANGVEVVTAPKLESLVDMLKKNRFDCYARAIFEANDEIKALDPKHFAIEESLAFYYPMPIFIFVSKSDPQLHARLKAGFEIILKNGQFDQHIEQFYGDSIKQVETNNRTLIPLINHNLTESTEKALKLYQ